MNPRRERDGESGMDRSSSGETDVQPLHKHRVEGSHHVCIPQAVHVPCRSRHPAVPRQDMVFTSSRAAIQGNLLLARGFHHLCLALVQH